MLDKHISFNEIPDDPHKMLAMLAITLSNNALVPDGFDEAGHQKVRLLSEKEIFERADKLTYLSFKSNPAYKGFYRSEW